MRPRCELVKVFSPIINANSGNAIYFRDLQQELSRSAVTIKLTQFPPFFECTPGIVRVFFPFRGWLDDFDIVHSNADYGVAFKRPDKPFVVTVHHNVFDDGYQKFPCLAQKAYYLGLLKRRIEKALNAADRVVAVSQYTKASLERAFRVANVQVIYNGIDTELFRPVQMQTAAAFAGKIRLLFVGNLIKRKGADLLPMIMQKLGTDYVLFYTAGLRAQATFTEPNMVVQVARSREDLVNLYNSSDLFLFPSRLEGFGYAVGEAMACGKPIVCTDGSSLPELVVNEKGGLLCRLDDVDDFVEKVRFLGTKPELRQSMGAFNRNRIVNDFSISRMGRDYSAFYRSGLRRC
jgi:glycosyltransferase involved in cell wall biosynthesis